MAATGCEEQLEALASRTKGEETVAFLAGALKLMEFAAVVSVDTGPGVTAMETKNSMLSGEGYSGREHSRSAARLESEETVSTRRPRR